MLICLILGLFLTFYGSDDGNLFMMVLGLILAITGAFGIIIFIGSNFDTIKSWFII